MGAKFVQLSSVFDPNDDAAIVFALDAEGKVWEFVGEGWEPLEMKRLSGPVAPAAEGGEEDDGEEES